MSAARGDALVLVARVGAHLCALPVGHIAETMRPLPSEPLGGAPSFVAGLSIIRGAPVPVVDARALLGQSQSSAPQRFVTVRTRDRLVALAVDEVIGVRSLTDLGARMPPLLQDAGAQVVRAIGSLDRELLLVLESGCLLPESVWTALEARGTAR